MSRVPWVPPEQKKMEGMLATLREEISRLREELDTVKLLSRDPDCPACREIEHIEDMKIIADLIPHPSTMSGWDDPEAPRDVLMKIKKVCEVKGIKMPLHIRNSEAHRER